MTYPEFYILGAPKSGTRTIEAWLRGRTDVILSAPECENHHATDIMQPTYDKDSCTRLHSPTRADQHVGEISDWYLHSRDAIPNIIAQRPETRFIVCLHDPAEAAWAMHSDSLSRGIEHVRDFNAAWDLGSARREGRDANLTGDPRLLDYAAIYSLGGQLARLLSTVPRKHIHFVFLEDLRQDPVACWNILQDFLNLPRRPLTDPSIRDFEIRKSLISLHDIMLWLQRVKRRLLPGLRTGLRIGTCINGRTRRSGVVKPIPRNARQKVSDLLSGDIATLSVLTDKDLMHWIA